MFTGVFQILAWKNPLFPAVKWLLQGKGTLSIPFNFAGRLNANDILHQVTMRDLPALPHNVVISWQVDLHPRHSSSAAPGLQARRQVFPTHTVPSGHSSPQG